MIGARTPIGNDNQLALIEMLKASLFSEIPSFADYVDWDKVLEEAKVQSVVTIATKVSLVEFASSWKEARLCNKAE